MATNNSLPGNDANLNKSADEVALQQIADFMAETTKVLAEIRNAFKEDIESRSEGFSTTSGRRRANSRRTGNLLLDAVGELVDIKTPSTGYAESLLQFNNYKPGTLMGYSYLASGAIQRLTQNRKAGEDVSQFHVNQSYTKNYDPASGQYNQNRVPTGRGNETVWAPGRMEPKHYQKLKDFALSDAGGMDEVSFNDMMDPKGKTSLTDLAARVRAMGDRDLNSAMDRMEAGNGLGLRAHQGARLAEKYLPYAQVAIDASQKAVGTLDKMYSRGRVSAGLGYGFDYSNPLIFGGGQFQMFQRDWKSKFTALRPGLSSEDTNAFRATIEASGFGQSGQEGAYGDIFNMMGDVTQKTGGALAPGQIMQVAELSMRSGRSSNSSMKELVKLLGDELPRAANASRLSIGKMHEQLMSTVQQVSQNPFNTSSGADIYRRSVSALNTGAQPAIGGLLAGNNQMLDYLTASRTGESIARATVNPFGAYNREQTIKQLIQQQLPGVNTLEDYNRLSVNNPDKLFAVQAYLRNFNIDENALPAFFSQNNNAVSAASLLGGLADTKSLKNSTGQKINYTRAGKTTQSSLYNPKGALGVGASVELVDTGGLVSIAGNTEVDPNALGSASKVLENNRDKIEQLRKLLTDQQKQDFDAKLKDLGNSGTATDLTKMFKETQANISQKNAEDQSNGVTISLDPNAAALFSLNNNGVLSKSAVIGGGPTPTTPGSLAGSAIDWFIRG